MDKICINLGSGQRKFRSTLDTLWVNYDSQARWNPDICDDGANLLNHFAPGSVECIVLHHVLEHFGCGEGKALVDACYRALKPEGSLIVCVPDMLQLVRGWIAQKIDTQVFLTNVYGAYMGDEADRHKWLYTPQTLMEFLQEGRDWRVRVFDWREIQGASLARDWWVLAMECVK